MWFLLYTNCESFYSSGRNYLVYSWTITKQSISSNMCLEKIFLSIYNIRKHHFLTTTWDNSRIFIFLLCAHQDSFEGKLVSKELIGRGVKVTCQCALPLHQGFCVTQEQCKSVVIHNLETWQNSHNLPSNLCLVFWGVMPFYKDSVCILLSVFPCTFFHYVVCLYLSHHLIIS